MAVFNPAIGARRIEENSMMYEGQILPLWIIHQRGFCWMSFIFAVMINGRLALIGAHAGRINIGAVSVAPELVTGCVLPKAMDTCSRPRTVMASDTEQLHIQYLKLLCDSIGGY